MSTENTWAVYIPEKFAKLSRRQFESTDILPNFLRSKQIRDKHYILNKGINLFKKTICFGKPKKIDKSYKTSPDHTKPHIVLLSQKFYKIDQCFNRLTGSFFFLFIPARICYIQVYPIIGIFNKLF